MSNPSARILTLRNNKLTQEELDISRIDAVLDNYEQSAEYFPIKYFLTNLYNIYNGCDEDFHTTNIQVKIHELLSYMDDLYLE
jgi:hypothetical protein